MACVPRQSQLSPPLLLPEAPLTASARPQLRVPASFTCPPLPRLSQKASRSRESRGSAIVGLGRRAALCRFGLLGEDGGWLSFGAVSACPRSRQSARGGLVASMAGSAPPSRPPGTPVVGFWGSGACPPHALGLGTGRRSEGGFGGSFSCCLVSSDAQATATRPVATAGPS